MYSKNNYIAQQELILEEVYLSDDSNEENPVDVYAEQLDGGKIISVCRNSGKMRFWELVGSQDEISKNHREEILNYRLAIVSEEDEVSLGDIFMYGKFTKEIL